MFLHINHRRSEDSWPGGWIGWAIFLGVSWTWCIGMFLPVILVRDYGFWAWAVFAAPNVIGAAAMGWFIDADQSREMVRTHRPAVTVFSVVTIAFQVFFAVWIFDRSSSSHGESAWLLAAIALVAMAATVRKASRLLAASIFLASIACAVGMFHHGEARLTSAGVQASLAASPTADIAWLTPVCLFGFFFCPYLDSTFHRARQHLDARNAKHAFGVGFGVIFFSAIILSLLYAHPVQAALASTSQTGAVFRWIKVYWIIQLGFTIGVHLIGDDSPRPAWTRGTIVLIAALSMAGVGILVMARWIIPGETIYRCFLGFYGLVFPAYVWLCIVPGFARGQLMPAPTRGTLTVFAIAVVIALPMFWMAFIDRELFWGVPAIAALLLARFLLPKSAPCAQPLAFDLINASPNSE